MSIELSPLVHIEIVVRDAEKAYEFLKKIFGAEKTQIEFANFLSSFGVAKTVHVKLSNVILQFIEPLIDRTLWANHLKEKGPGVHNLTFIVDDINKAKKALEQEGVKVLLEMPFDWKRLLGSDVRRDTPPVAMIGGEDIVGFRFELSENPLKNGKSPDEYFK